jgi:hypothetical protein
MDPIELMMQKYGDKLELTYKALRDQYFTYNILTTIIIISVIGFFVSLILFTIVNVNDNNFDSDYFNKSWGSYDNFKWERTLVCLNFIVPILFVILGITAFVLIGILAPDYGFIRSIMGG